MKRGSAHIVRKLNRYSVLQCVLENGPMSSEEIVRKTHLSRPTVTNIVKELLNDAILKKDGFGESTGGREPMLLNINEARVFAIGIDFEYPKVIVGIMNFLREPVVVESLELEKDVEPKDIVDMLLTSIDTLIDRFPYSQKDIIGIGVAISGIIDTEVGMSSRIERIDNWENVPIRRILEDRYKIPTYIRNDVHLLATVEQEKRRDLPKDFIYVGVRSGIGMAVIMDGEVYTGIKGNAGFLGHMTIEIDGQKCVCGQKGCVETAVGQLMLKRQYMALSNKLYADVEKSSRFYSYLHEQSLRGDTVAENLLEKACVYLACGLANVVKILEISTIIIEGARPILEEEKYRQIFMSTLRNHLFENIREDISIITSMAENELIIHACSELVFKEYIKDKYTLNGDLDKVHVINS